jgi:tRNA wybutosine-synthesizing protein 3
LHILTSSLDDAQCALSAGMEAGFRESGIGSVTGSDATPLVAVRSGGLAFDCVIGYAADADGIRLLVPPAYIRMMLEVANRRFAANGERRERFRYALRRGLAGGGSDGARPAGWEPEDVRRERKRAEGLRRREELASRRPRQEMSDAPTEQDAVDLGVALNDGV